MVHPWIVTFEIDLEFVVLAKAVYESFRAEEEIATKKKLPTWLQLPAHTRASWEEAAMTALRQLTNRTIEVRV